MLAKLNTLYQDIEQRKAEMLVALEALTDQERNTHPTPTEWSPLQVMDHVVVVEEWMSGPNEAVPPANGKALLKGHLFMLLGVGVMRTGLRIPTLPMLQPRRDLDYMAIKQRWDNARAMLAPKLAAVTAETLPVPIALHPVAGPLNAPQVLELLDIHLAYHLRYFPQVRHQKRKRP